MKSHKLALAAVGAAVSLVFIVLSYYVPNVKVALNALAAFGVLLPLTKGYYREAALSSIAVIIIGLFWVNVYILPFALVGSLYTIATVYGDTHGIKIYIQIPIKLVYAVFTFFVFYSLASLITVELSVVAGWLGGLSPTWLYVVFAALWCAAFLVYDAVLLMCFRYIKTRFKL